MTVTDEQFAARFPGLSASVFNGNNTDWSQYTPTESPINTGMMSDIGRATVYGPDVQMNPFQRFMRAPLGRGDAVLKSAVKGVKSRAYNPLAPDTDLFNGQRPGFYNNIAKKNLSRQIALEVNDYMMKQFVQTPEMINSAQNAIMATSNVAYLDDMYVSAKEYFSATTRSAKSTQLHTMTANVDDPAFGEEMTELLWKISQKDFGYKSDKYNAAGRECRSEDVSIILKKDAEWPAFKKLLADTFNPEMLRVATGGIDYVEDFATVTAGKPIGAGELLGIVVDNRAWDITPMPDTLTVESFRNGARKSTTYFVTYEYAFQDSPFFNKAMIFAPAGA